MAEMLAKLVCLYKPADKWIEVFRKDLTSPVVRIGRVKTPPPPEKTLIPGVMRTAECEFFDIDMSFARNKDGYYCSKQHATLFKWHDMIDYQILDGTYSTATFADPLVTPIPSSIGVFVNGKRLLLGEKRNLKHEDVIELFPGVLKLIYLRPQNTISDELNDTIIPEEYRKLE